MLARMIRLFALGTIVVVIITSCGGGGNYTAAPPVETKIELRSEVVTIPPEEAPNYTVSSASNTVAYVGTKAPAADSVFILNDAAYKVVSLSIANGTTLLTTITPDFQDVFETLKISAQIALTPTKSQRDPAKKHALYSVQTPNFKLAKSITGKTGQFPTEGTLSAEVTQGIVTAIFDYTRAGGLKAAELSYDGLLKVAGDLAVGPTERKDFEILMGNPIDLAVPDTLGLIRFKLPIVAHHSSC